MASSRDSCSRGCGKDLDISYGLFGQAGTGARTGVHRCDLANLHRDTNASILNEPNSFPVLSCCCRCTRCPPQRTATRHSARPTCSSTGDKSFRSPIKRNRATLALSIFILLFIYLFPKLRMDLGVGKIIDVAACFKYRLICIATLTIDTAHKR